MVWDQNCCSRGYGFGIFFFKNCGYSDDTILPYPLPFAIPSTNMNSIKETKKDFRGFCKNFPNLPLSFIKFSIRRKLAISIPSFPRKPPSGFPQSHSLNQHRKIGTLSSCPCRLLSLPLGVSVYCFFPFSFTRASSSPLSIFVQAQVFHSSHLLLIQLSLFSA